MEREQLQITSPAYSGRFLLAAQEIDSGELPAGLLCLVQEEGRMRALPLPRLAGEGGFMGKVTAL